MATLFKFLQDQGGNTGSFMPYTAQNYTATLAISTDTTLTIPGEVVRSATGQKGDYAALITVSDAVDVWVALNVAAAVPAGASFAASASMLVNANNSRIFIVSVGDVLHFITATATKNVCVSLYTL